MPPALAAYIVKYGYLAVFGLVFLQEIGVPNPVPNEFVLLFSGYLASAGTFDFFTIFLTVVAADVIGTSVLYVAFYFFGQKVLAKWPKLIPHKNVERLKNKISGKGRWGIYLGRLLPYLRGYTSVAAGLLNIPPGIYVPAVILSAITWSGGYVIAGKLLGPRWTTLAAKVGAGKAAIGLILILIIIIFIMPRVVRWYQKRKLQNQS